MSALRIDLKDIKSVNNGSVSVNRIMNGSSRIWPVYPYYLLKNGTYYNVTGMTESAYTMQQVPDIVCPLGKTFSEIRGTARYRKWARLECVFAHTSYNLIFINSQDQYVDFELFVAGTTIYFDYMSKYSSGGSWNRLQKSGVGYMRDFENTTTLYKVEAYAQRSSTSVNNGRTYITCTQLPSTQLFSVYQTAYTPNDFDTTNALLRIGKTGADHRVALCYAKYCSEEGEVLSFVYWKKTANNVWMLFDAVTGKFLTDYITDMRELNPDVVYEETSCTHPPVVSEYYYPDGTITDGTDTYERLVNNKTGNVLRGIKI